MSNLNIFCMTAPTQETVILCWFLLMYIIFVYNCIFVQFFSWIVLLHHCPMFGMGWAPTNMFNTSTFCMCLSSFMSLPTSSSCLLMLLITVVFHLLFCTYILALVVLDWDALPCLQPVFRAFYKWIRAMGVAFYWKSYIYLLLLKSFEFWMKVFSDKIHSR